MIKKYCFSGRDVRAAEGARLEIVCMPTKVYRGFDSRSLRQKNPFMSLSCEAIKYSHLIIVIITDEQLQLVLAINKTILVATCLGFWPGLDISLYSDRRFLWQSVFDVFSKKSFIYCYSAIYP